MQGVVRAPFPRFDRAAGGFSQARRAALVDDGASVKVYSPSLTRACSGEVAEVEKVTEVTEVAEAEDVFKLVVVAEVTEEAVVEEAVAVAVTFFSGVITCIQMAHRAFVAHLSRAQCFSASTFTICAAAV